MGWLIYALGGGWGHLTRAVALARAAQAYAPVCILTNSPYAEHVRAGVPEIEILTVIRDEVLGHVGRLAPEALIVDTFPRGLGGELASALGCIPAKKILVHRDLEPSYVAWGNLREFVAAAYDLILIPGEGEGDAFADLPQALTTRPWLVRSADELLACDGPRPCVSICAGGNSEEQDWYAEVASILGVAVERYWPMLDRYNSVDVVVGGGGYNTVHECLACGVPLVARAWPRKYDRQQLRLLRAKERGAVTLVESAEEAADAALRYLEAGTKATRRADFVNGAHEAALAVTEKYNV